MAWLHTWTGLLMGWLLFAMFVTGTAAYFQEEITRWMKPELVGATNPVAATQGAMDHLQKVEPDAESWFITQPSARNPATSIFRQPKKKEGEKRERRPETRDRRSVGKGKRGEVRVDLGGGRNKKKKT